MNRLTLLCVAPIALAAGCSSPAVSTVNFHSPPGSKLVFQDDDQLTVATAVFPANLELAQFASPGGEGRPFKGTLRVNGLVEEERIPSNARSLLVENEGGVDVPVRGFYRVFERAASESESESESESLTVYRTEVTTEQLLRIMDGKPVTVTAEDEGALSLEIGLDLDVEKSSDSE